MYNVLKYKIYVLSARSSMGGEIMLQDTHYLRINIPIHIHLRLDGGFAFERSEFDLDTRLFFSLSRTTEFTFKNKNYKRAFQRYLNEVERDLFIKICEETELSTVVRELKKRYDENVVKKTIDDFIYMGIISLSQEYVPPRENCDKIEFSGSIERFYPMHLVLELTTACTLRCRHCYVEAGPEKASYLPFENLVKVLKYLKDRGLTGVELTGGEPFLHPNFREIVKFCAENFKIVGILTNGTMITDNDIKFLSQYHNVVMSVSLDSATPEFHDWLRGVDGAWEKAVNAIQKLSARNIPVRVAMIVTPMNFKDIEATLLLAKKLGAVAFSFSPLLPLGRGADPIFEFKLEEALELAKITRKVIEEYSDFVPLPDITSASRRNCGAGHISVTISATGTVKPCVVTPDTFITFGNILKDSPETIFSSTKISLLAKTPWPNERYCRGCMYENFCKYCILRALMIHKLGLRGKPQTPKHDCAWALQLDAHQILE